MSREQPGATMQSQQEAAAAAVGLRWDAAQLPQAAAEALTDLPLQQHETAAGTSLVPGTNAPCAYTSGEAQHQFWPGHPCRLTSLGICAPSVSDICCDTSSVAITSQYQTLSISLLVTPLKLITAAVMVTLGVGGKMLSGQLPL